MGIFLTKWGMCKLKKLLLASKSFKIGYRITGLVFISLKIYVKLILARILQIIFISMLSKYVDVKFQFWMNFDMIQLNANVNKD